MSIGASTSGISQDNNTITADQLSFSFGNLCGTPYGGGAVVFSSDGNCLFSGASNRVQLTDLGSNRSWTAEPELRSSTALIVPMPVDASKFGKLVLGIDVDGYGLLFESTTGVVLNRLNFKGRVKSAVFSPDGKYLATAIGRRIKVWKAASVDTNWQFVMFRQFAGHIGDVSSLEFAPCLPGQPDLLLSAGTDSIVRVWSLNFEEAPHAILNDHTQSIVGASFFNGRSSVVAVNRSGTVLVWDRSGSTGTYTVANKSQIQSGVGYVTSCAFDAFSGLLCLGLSGGAFTLYTLPSMEAVQSLSVGAAVSAVALSRGGDWVAVGVEDAGQLIVWEWKAENFVFRQQGHHDGVNCVAFCPVATRVSSDLLEAFGSERSATFSAGGGLMATGGVEGKVKLWHSLTGFCFVTFADHTSSVEAVAFTPQGNAVVSASMDGSVRAYDLLRYKNFRTFVAPDARVQFGSLAMDASGSIVAAGAANGSYGIYLWSMQTGQCLDILVGHEARISHLKFAPGTNDGILASASWDSSLKVWDVYAKKNKGGVAESLINQREVTCCAFDPVDGTVVAAATLAGHITFWDTRSGAEVGAIDAVRDIGSGRKEGERFSSGALKGKKSKRDGTGTEVNLNQYFSALEYGGAAGRWLAAVAKSSAFLCIFDPLEKTLIRRIELTTHCGLSGVKQFLNSRFHSDLVADDGFDDLDRAEKKLRGIAAATALPGVSRGDMRAVNAKRVWRVNGLCVSSDGQEMAVASSEGAIVLSLGGRSQIAFSPVVLSEEVSTAAVEEALALGDSQKATIYALSLNDADSFRKVFNAVPAAEEMAKIISNLPQNLFYPLLRHVAQLMHPVDGSRQIERAMRWISLLIKLRFPALQFVVHQTSVGRDMRAALCSILQHVQTQSAALGGLLRDNMFVLSFLAGIGQEDELEESEPLTTRLEDVLA